MAYKHGIYIKEEATSVVAPVSVESAMPVFFVTAPINLSQKPYGVTNVPVLCYSFKDAVSAFGFCETEEEWGKYTSNEVIKTMFSLYNVAPCVIVNVLDPTKHKEEKTGNITFKNGVAKLLESGVLKDTLKIGEYKIDEDYIAEFDDDGFLMITVIKDISDGETAVSYSVIDPSKVSANDFIGGVNSETGKNEGLELISEIYPRFRLVPCQIVVPKYSQSPSVAAVMETKCNNINGVFNAICLVDLPTMTAENKKIRYSEIAEWKNENNLVGANMLCCYPLTELDGYAYHLSTQLAGCIAMTDYDNGGVPSLSPSNHAVKINGLRYADGEEFILPKEQADYLNGNAIVTAINFTNGWTAWGNRTAIYPSSTDVKDVFIPTRRMFNWLGNSIAINYFSKVDYPLLRRSIDTIVDSVTMWLNSLSSQEYILGGTIEFAESDNLTTSLIDGTVVFRIKFAPPSPMRDVEFILEYDPDYLSALF